MSSSSSQGPHPLARRLIAAATEHPPAGPVIEVGAGFGRNTRALVEARIPVVSIPDDVPYTQLQNARETFGAALATHAYIHGSSAKVRAGLAELRRVLVPGAPVFITLGSFRDARYGLGVPVDERSFAPGDGEEAGIPHAYFDRDGITEVMTGFTVESAEEAEVDEIVGRWAHADDVGGRVHWFVVARRG